MNPLSYNWKKALICSLFIGVTVRGLAMPGNGTDPAVCGTADASGIHSRTAPDAESPSMDGTQPSSPVSTPSLQEGPSVTSYASSADEVSDNKWHFYSTGYLWLPGIHGTLGVRGFETGVHVSAVDLLKNFRFGVLGTFIPTYNRFSLPVDYMWLRLKDDKAVPMDPAYTVNAKVTMSIVTPKIAYLIVNRPRIQIYGNMGPRIWYEGTTLSLSPEVLGSSLYKSVTWTDFVAGGRFSVPLGKKVGVNVLGDAGEGGATLDYQVAGFINYQWKPKVSVQGGWRYLTAHYGNNGNLFNGTMQGMIFGATYKFK